MTKYKERLWEVLPVALLVISVPIFFGHVIWSGKSLFGSDFVLYFYPIKKFIRDYVMSHGSIPLWNPHQFSGTPLIANMQASMFYPLGLLFYLMPVEQAYGYTVILHSALGAIFMYAFLRSLRINKSGAFIAAFVFTYNGFFVAHLYAGHLTFVQNYIWIPLIFLYVTKFVSTACLRHALLAGLFLGFQVLGGFPQIAFYTILAIGLFGAYHIAIRLRCDKMSRLFRLSGGLVMVVLFGFALAAVQLLPTYEFRQLSTRSGGVTYEFATNDSLNPINFITFLMPNFFGNPANHSYWRSTEPWQFWELCGFVGITPLLLLCFLKFRSQTRHPQIFFGMLLLLSLFLSLGRHNPFYYFIYHLPGFHHFRIPAQILYLYVFSLSILAGVGLNNLNGLKVYPRAYKIAIVIGFLFFGLLITALLLRPVQFFYYVFWLADPSSLTPDLMPRLHETVRLSLLTAAGFFIMIAALIRFHFRNHMGPAALFVTLVLVAVIELWSFSNPMIRTTDLSSRQNNPGAFDFLKNDQEIYRVVDERGGYTPNDGILRGYEDVQGYDPFTLKRYIDYLNKSQNLPMSLNAVNVQYITHLANPLIRMLNVKYSIWDDAGVLKQRDYMPRAHMVHQARKVPGEKILDLMMSDDFNPTETVVFEAESQSYTLPDANGKNFSGTCSINYYDNEMIRLETSADKPGYLVLSQIFYPGWEATVDGDKVPVLRGNYLFQVVPLEPGRHEVKLRFVSWPFRMGTGLSILSLVVFLCLIVRKPKQTNGIS